MRVVVAQIIQKSGQVTGLLLMMLERIAGRRIERVGIVAGATVV